MHVLLKLKIMGFLFNTPAIYERSVGSYDELVANLGEALDQAEAYGKLDLARAAFESGLAEVTLDLEYSFDMYYCVTPSLRSLGWKEGPDLNAPK